MPNKQKQLLFGPAWGQETDICCDFLAFDKGLEMYANLVLAAEPEGEGGGNTLDRSRVEKTRKIFYWLQEGDHLGERLQRLGATMSNGKFVVIIHELIVDGVQLEEKRQAYVLKDGGAVGGQKITASLTRRIGDDELLFQVEKQGSDEECRIVGDVPVNTLVHFRDYWLDRWLPNLPHDEDITPAMRAVSEIEPFNSLFLAPGPNAPGPGLPFAATARMARDDLEIFREGPLLYNAYYPFVDQVAGAQLGRSYQAARLDGVEEVPETEVIQQHRHLTQGFLDLGQAEPYSTLPGPWGSGVLRSTEPIIYEVYVPVE